MSINIFGDDFVGRKGAYQYLNVSPSTLERIIDRGELPVYRDWRGRRGYRWFRRSDLAKLLLLRAPRQETQDKTASIKDEGELVVSR